MCAGSLLAATLKTWSLMMYGTATDPRNGYHITKQKKYQGMPSNCAPSMTATYNRGGSGGLSSPRVTAAAAALGSLALMPAVDTAGARLAWLLVISASTVLLQCLCCCDVSVLPLAT